MALLTIVESRARQRRCLLAAAAGTLALLLGACGGAEPGTSVSPGTTAAPSTLASITPTPSESPVDDRAKAFTDAEAAFTTFLRVFDQVLEEGGTKPERLEAVATDRALTYAKNVAADFRKNEYRAVGKTTIVTTKPLTYKPSAGGAVVTLRSCEDARTSKAEQNGKPLPKLPGTPDFLVYTVTVTSSDPTSGDATWTVSRLQNKPIKSC